MFFYFIWSPIREYKKEKIKKWLSLQKNSIDEWMKKQKKCLTFQLIIWQCNNQATNRLKKCQPTQWKMHIFQVETLFVSNRKLQYELLILCIYFLFISFLLLSDVRCAAYISAAFIGNSIGLFAFYPFAATFRFIDFICFCYALILCCSSSFLNDIFCSFFHSICVNTEITDIKLELLYFF